jgi:hypothetical protein
LRDGARESLHDLLTLLAQLAVAEILVDHARDAKNVCRMVGFTSTSRLQRVVLGACRCAALATREHQERDRGTGVGEATDHAAAGDGLVIRMWKDDQDVGEPSKIPGGVPHPQRARRRRRPNQASGARMRLTRTAGTFGTETSG